MRDFLTGDSLQYCFITFETEKAAEEAYFKMQGALVDDRRLSLRCSQERGALCSDWKSSASP